MYSPRQKSVSDDADPTLEFRCVSTYRSCRDLLFGFGARGFYFPIADMVVGPLMQPCSPPSPKGLARLSPGAASLGVFPEPAPCLTPTPAWEPALPTPCRFATKAWESGRLTAAHLHVRWSGRKQGCGAQFSQVSLGSGLAEKGRGHRRGTVACLSFGLCEPYRESTAVPGLAEAALQPLATLHLPLGVQAPRAPG